MSSKLFMPAAVFLLCLACVVAAGAQTQPDCGALLNSKSAVQANANSGDAYVQFCLGLTYEAGQVVPRDYAQAHHWYLQAATDGDHAIRGAILGALTNATAPALQVTRQRVVALCDETA